MTLAELKEGNVAEIKKLSGGKNLMEKIQGFGLFVGGKVRLERKAPFRGPLLVKDLENDARLMIGRGLAAKVEVKVLESKKPR
jgi:Fe2+ transport system protein FeoA